MPEGVWWEVRNVQSREGGEVQEPNLLTSQFFQGSALPSLKTVGGVGQLPGPAHPVRKPLPVWGMASQRALLLGEGRG